MWWCCWNQQTVSHSFPLRKEFDWKEWFLIEALCLVVILLSILSKQLNQLKIIFNIHLMQLIKWWKMKHWLKEPNAMSQVPKFKFETRTHHRLLLCCFRCFSLKERSFPNLTSPTKIFNNNTHYLQTKANLDLRNT